MTTISLSAMEKILRKAGAERVSKSAAEEFSAVLEDIGLLIARDAVEYSKHAGRKTVLADDLKLAKKKF